MSQFSDILINIKRRIQETVMNVLAANLYQGSSYTAWELMQEDAISALKELLVELFPDEQISFPPRKGKNEYPDLKVLYKGDKYAIDIKSVFVQGERASGNDLGTMNSFAKKRIEYADQFFLFIRYQTTEPGARTFNIDAVFFDYSWRTVGRRADKKSVNYREKDGNLRPKPWRMFDADESYYATEDEFMEAFNNAVALRAKSIITRQSKLLSSDDLRECLRKIEDLITEREHNLTPKKELPASEADIQV